MKDDYTTNSHGYLAYTLSLWEGWENVLFELGSETVLVLHHRRNYNTSLYFHSSQSFIVPGILLRYTKLKWHHTPYDQTLVLLGGGHSDYLLTMASSLSRQLKSLSFFVVVAKFEWPPSITERQKDASKKKLRTHASRLNQWIYLTDLLVCNANIKI